VALGLTPAYAALCAVQGALVLAPRRPRRLGRSWAVGLVVPLAALVVGVLAIRGTSDGADALASLATVAAPLLAAACGPALGWRLPWLTVPAAAGAYLLAWRGDGLAADLAGVLLIGGACLTLAAVIGALAPPPAIAAGLVVLAAVDAALVFGNQVAPATDVLHAVTPPSAPLPGAATRPLPALQDATIRGALMGWLDFLAPALLGVLLADEPEARTAAAVATFLAALAWSLLFARFDTLPATVPVLAGLAVWAAWPRPVASRAW
jgi:hypothetical protein